MAKHYLIDVFGCVEPECRGPYSSFLSRDAAVAIVLALAVSALGAEADVAKLFPGEYETIKEAAQANQCEGEMFIILLAIRKAESGPAGTEFGVLNPKAKDTNLRTQAGWAAATIVKNHVRWVKAGKPGEFTAFLAKRYCPIGAGNDPQGLNRHWERNVRWWTAKIKAAMQT